MLIERYLSREMSFTVYKILEKVTSFFAENKDEESKFREEIKNTNAEKVAAGGRLIEALKINLPFCKDEKCADKAKRIREKGNVYFGTNSLSSALRFYTESIANAPPKSEALAIGFANRSVVLQRMGHLEECLGDIERAFVCGYPPHLAYKALARRGLCLKLLGKPNQALQSFADAIQHLEKSKLESHAKETLRTKLEDDMKACKLEENELPFDFTKLSLHPPRPELPPLGFGQNAELPSVSDCVDLRHNEERGRHLVANRDIQSG